MVRTKRKNGRPAGGLLDEAPGSVHDRGCGGDHFLDGRPVTIGAGLVEALKRIEARAEPENRIHLWVGHHGTRIVALGPAAAPAGAPARRRRWTGRRGTSRRHGPTARTPVTSDATAGRVHDDGVFAFSKRADSGREGVHGRRPCDICAISADVTGAQRIDHVNQDARPVAGECRVATAVEGLGSNDLRSPEPEAQGGQPGNDEQDSPATLHRATILPACQGG